jgi:predicted transcriptional regulator
MSDAHAFVPQPGCNICICGLTEKEHDDYFGPACRICNDRYVVAVAGPDENGQYDTDDCVCTRLDYDPSGDDPTYKEWTP